MRGRAAGLREIERPDDNLGTLGMDDGLLGELHLIFHSFALLFHLSSLSPYSEQGAAQMNALASHLYRLSSDRAESQDGYGNASESCDDQGNVWKLFGRKQPREVALRMFLGPIANAIGCLLIYRVYLNGRLRCRRLRIVLGMSAILIIPGWSTLLLRAYWQDGCEQSEYGQPFQHGNTLALEARLAHGKT